MIHHVTIERSGYVRRLHGWYCECSWLPCGTALLIRLDNGRRARLTVDGPHGDTQEAGWLDVSPDVADALDITPEGYDIEFGTYRVLGAPSGRAFDHRERKKG